MTWTYPLKTIRYGPYYGNYGCRRSFLTLKKHIEFEKKDEMWKIQKLVLKNVYLKSFKGKVRIFNRLMFKSGDSGFRQ